jgi:DNA-binding winged helix-turn-helix (wHTH) protein
MSPGYVTVGTQLLSRPGYPDAEPAPPWDEQVPPPGRDATLLAVVPIPGTGTSLAIVGYAIATDPERGPLSARPAAARPSARRPADSGVLLDHARRQVWAGGEQIALTFQEFELLAFLSAHPATVFSRADLVEQVWRRNPGRDASAVARDARAVARDSRTVDVHVSRVRQKLGPLYGQCLVTEYRVGYQFRPLAS